MSQSVSFRPRDILLIISVVLLFLIGGCAKESSQRLSEDLESLETTETLETPAIPDIPEIKAPPLPAEVSLIDCAKIDISSVVQNVCGADYLVNTVAKGDVEKGSYTAEFHLGQSACTFRAERSQDFWSTVILGMNRFENAEKAQSRVDAVVARSEEGYSRKILEEFEPSNGKAKLFEEGTKSFQQTMLIIQQSDFALYIQPLGGFLSGSSNNPFCTNPDGMKKLGSKILEYLVNK